MPLATKTQALYPLPLSQRNSGNPHNETNSRFVLATSSDDFGQEATERMPRKGKSNKRDLAGSDASCLACTSAPHEHSVPTTVDFRGWDIE